MRILTKYNIGDKIKIRKTQYTVDRIKIDIGTTYPNFNDEQKNIKYNLSSKNHRTYIKEIPESALT